jgi:hypothetical protein
LANGDIRGSKRGHGWCAYRRSASLLWRMISSENRTLFGIVRGDEIFFVLLVVPKARMQRGIARTASFFHFRTMRGEGDHAFNLH